MSLTLKFVTGIIKPLEKLNTDLTKQNSIDSNISDFITIAGNLAVQLSHFPENAGHFSLRSSTSCKEFEIIVHVADAWKHNFSDKDRDNKLILGSQFEINSDDTKYRFIRNAITIDHIKLGKFDFLKTAIEASQFIINKLNLNIIWKPSVLEAIEVWSDGVSLDIEYVNQIAWGGLKLETLRRNSEGQLVHTNGFTEMPFSIKEEIPIKAISFKDYIIQLFAKSIPSGQEIIIENKIYSKNEDSFEYDVSIKSTYENHVDIVVKIINSTFSLNDFNSLSKFPDMMGIKKLILVSFNEFNNEIKQLACELSNKLYLLSINKLDAHNIPLGLLTKHSTHQNIKLTSVKNVIFGVLKENADLYDKLGKEINRRAKDFSFDQSTLISLEEICLSHIKPKAGKLSGNKSIKYQPRDNYKLYYKIGDLFIRVGISAEFEWEIESMQIPLPILTYNKSSMGLSIWNLEGVSKKGGNWVHHKFPVTKYGTTSALGILSQTNAN